MKRPTVTHIQDGELISFLGAADKPSWSSKENKSEPKRVEELTNKLNGTGPVSSFMPAGQSAVSR